MSKVEIKGLQKRFGKNVQALDEVTFTVDSGKILALVGASGCGKTTLLRAIAGLEVPDSGSISIGDQVLVGCDIFVPPEKRRVGVVFQGEALFPHMRVLANLTFAMKHLPKEQRVPRAIKLLGMVGLQGLEKRYPHELSGGQRRRVALIRTLAQEPQVVLLDEPLSGLDESLRTDVRDEVHRVLTQSARTAIWVTHSAKDALGVADIVVVMAKGKIVQVGAPIDVYDSPVSLAVARLFGPMNIVSATRVGEVLDTALGSIPWEGDEEPQSVGIRPHDIVINGPESTSVGLHADGTVERIAFEGERCTAFVSTGSSQLYVGLPTHHNFSVGQKVRVFLPRSALTVFRTEKRKSHRGR